MQDNHSPSDDDIPAEPEQLEVPLPEESKPSFPSERPLLNPDDPRSIARAVVSRYYDHPECRTLAYCAEVFFAWGMNGSVCWQPVEPQLLRRQVYELLEGGDKWAKGKGGGRVPIEANKAIVDRVLDALKSVCDSRARNLDWLAGKDPDDPNADQLAVLPPERAPADAARILSAPNGLYLLGGYEDLTYFSAPTPRLFALNALDYKVDPEAKPPQQWLTFVRNAFPDDPESINLLGEWFGYCLTPRTDQHKALLVVGPRRSGKGTISRILNRMLGDHNVAGPTLSQLGTNFGLASLLDKRLATVDDARLNARADLAVITERILSIVGEGKIDVDRKNKDIVSTRIRARLMILTNELPRLPDASGALVSRFLMLRLTESHLNREDVGLEARLASEMSGILLWAVKGFARLTARGRFLQPAKSQEYLDEMADLSSPASAFVRENCVLERGASVRVDDLWSAWQAWCKEEGVDHPGTKVTFGKNLRAAAAGVEKRSDRNPDAPRARGEEGSHRVKTYFGIRLNSAGEARAIQGGVATEAGDDDRRANSMF